MIGNVARFDDGAGFGFVASLELGREVFFHRKHLVDPGQEIEVSMLVEFGLERDARGLHAADVRVIDTEQSN